jgi:hypothetical protein
MKFKNVDKLSPIVFYEDLPWQEDYFHLKPEEVTKEFKLHGLYDIDVQWWEKQNERCLNGFQVEDTIDYGGDVYRDEKEAFWNDSMAVNRYVKEIDYVIPPNCCYIPMYDLLIKNKTVRISGRHYFYLNFGKIYALDNSKEKKVVSTEYEDMKGLNSPMFTDVDWGFFVRIANMFKFRKDDSEMKTRQLGYSRKSGIGLMGFNFSFLPHSQTIVAGGMSDDADNTFSICRDFLETLNNTQFYKEKKRGGDRDDFVKALRFGSDVRSISCKDNTQALSRFTPFLTIFEEGGKWKKGLIKKVSEFNKAAQKAQGKKTGFNVFIATGGDMDAGAADMETIHYNPDSYTVMSYDNIWEKDDSCITKRSGHFTPGWQFKMMDENGNSLKEPSLKFLEEELKLKKEIAERYIFKTQFAVYAADAFMIASGGFFGEEIVLRCNARKAYIITHGLDDKKKVGRLEWKDPKHPLKGVDFFNDEKGSITIFEEPEVDNNNKVYENLYKAGTDSYDQDEAKTSVSKGDIRIYKTFLNANKTYNKFVAKCTDRPAEAQGGKNIWYENTAKLCVYYGIQSANLIEWSKILIVEWYINNNFDSLLKERPGLSIATWIKKSDSTNRYGIDTSTKLHWLTKYRKWLEIPENIEGIDDVEQLTSIAKFKLDPKYNCDTTIACSLAIVCAEDDLEMEVRSSGDTKPDDKLRKYKRVGDKIIEVFE